MRLAAQRHNTLCRVAAHRIGGLRFADQPYVLRRSMMSLQVITLEALTEDEVRACAEYSASATLLHACTQGWETEFPDYVKLREFAATGAAPFSGHLDRAIQKFELAADGIVFSGHGRPFSLVGSLFGPPERFVGLGYRYLGYTSTSSERGVAEDILRPRATRGTPVLLELHLNKGQRILPIPAVVRVGEAEYVLGRGEEFRIVDAKFANVAEVQQNVLHLVLKKPDD